MKVFLIIFLALPAFGSTAVFNVDSNTLTCHNGNLFLDTASVDLPGTVRKDFLNRDLGFQSTCESARTSILGALSGKVELPIQFQATAGRIAEVVGCRTLFKSGATHCTAVRYCTVNEYDT